MLDTYLRYDHTALPQIFLFIDEHDDGLIAITRIVRNTHHRQADELHCSLQLIQLQHLDLQGIELSE